MNYLNRVLDLINEARFKKSKDYPQPKETQHEFDYAKFLKVTPKASQEMRKFIRHGGAMGYDVADPRGSRTRRIFKRNESNMNYYERIHDLLVEAVEINEVEVSKFTTRNYPEQVVKKGGKKYRHSYSAVGVKGDILTKDHLKGQRAMGDAIRKSKGLPKLKGTPDKRIADIIKGKEKRGQKGTDYPRGEYHEPDRKIETSYTSGGHNPERFERAQRRGNK